MVDDGEGTWNHMQVCGQAAGQAPASAHAVVTGLKLDQSRGHYESTERHEIESAIGGAGHGTC